MENNSFEVREAHIMLIKSMYMTWNCTCFGAPTVDTKRPYGNTFVYEDIAKILDIRGEIEQDGEILLSDKQMDELLKLHKETEIALQILLYNCSIEPGLYMNKGYSNEWILLKE